MSVRRYDTSTLSAPIRLDNGYLRANANITKVGVFTYHDGAGGKIRELRHPDDVFNEDSLATFELVPFTNDHPPAELDASNTKDFQAGTVTKAKKSDDDVHVEATIQITDADTIATAESGKVEVSCGYRCDLLAEEGVTKDIPGIPDGIKYDARQTNIRANHVALVERARAGKTAKLKLDSGDAICIAELTETEPLSGQKEKPKMETIKVDGVSVEVQPEVAKAFAAKVAEVADLTKALEVEKARADAAQEKVDQLSDEEVIRGKVADRLSLERSAAVVLKDTKLDGMTAKEIHTAVIMAVSPKANLEGKSDDHIAARFDQAIESFEDKEEIKEDKEETKPSVFSKMVVNEDGEDEFNAASVEAARKKALGL